MIIDQAMLMAAGLGTRLRPYTDLAPKPLLPLMGVPMAQFAVDGLAAGGVRRIVANVHHLAARGRAGLLGLDLGGAALAISDESRELLGSAGGIRKALLSFGKAPFFYVNGDVVSAVDWKALSDRHAELRAKRGVVMTLTVFREAPAGGRYREIHFDAGTGLVSRVGDFAERRAFFVGAAALEPEAFAHLPEERPSDFVAEVLLPEVARGRVGVFLAEGPWMDIGSPALWHAAHLQMARGWIEGSLPSEWRRRIAPGILATEAGRVVGRGFEVDLARALVTYGSGGEARAAGHGQRDGILYAGLWTGCAPAGQSP
jgi:MurNAc alpha-1-phosphate uridylyltransferase